METTGTGAPNGRGPFFCDQDRLNYHRRGKLPMTSANLDYCGIVKLIRALVDANACTEAEAQKVARRIAARIGADILFPF